MSIPEPLSHLYTISRDAVQPNWFTVSTLSGETFRILSPEFGSLIDDMEAKRFESRYREGEEDKT